MSWIPLTDLPDGQLVAGTYVDRVYWQVADGQVVHQGRPNRTADVGSFEVLEGSNFIARDKNYVYNAWTTLKSVDRATFEPRGDGYFSDKHMVHFDYEASLKPLKGRTVDEFAVLGNGYARDAKFGYYCGKVITKCTSPLTLELAGSHATFGARDEDHVYFEAALLRGADPLTWQEGENGFSVDAKSVYFGAAKLGGATPENWRPLIHPYSTNGSKVYFMQHALPGADLESFEVLPDGTCRDKTSAFSGKRRV